MNRLHLVAACMVIVATAIPTHAQNCGWSALGAGAGGGSSSTRYVWALSAYDHGSGSALYAGGGFITAGGQPANRIAKWDGSTWSPLGSGMNAPVYALTVFDYGIGPALYAGGEFTTAGGQPAGRIATWDGSAWSSLGEGVNGTVRAMTTFNDGTGTALYAGGYFTIASGGAVVNRVAKWDGAFWSPLGAGVNDYVQALAVFDDGSGPALYAGGQFTTAGGQAANRIAKWNGSSWSPLGSGVNNYVYALAAFDDGTGGGPALYAGGRFTTAGGQPASYIAKWNGSAWSPVGSGVNNYVYNLTVHDDGFGPALYAGGQFTTAGGQAANRIAKWDGASWSRLGSGVDNTAGAMAAFDDGSGYGPALYTGGYFSTAGGPAAALVARWIHPTTLCPVDLDGNCIVNFFDLTRFGNLFQARDPAADFNGDGLFNFFDFSAYLLAFNAGCP